MKLIGRLPIWLVILTLATVPCAVLAVPGSLDGLHRPLSRFLRDYVRQVTRTDRSMSYIRSDVHFSALQNNPQWAEYQHGLARADGSKIRPARRDDQIAFLLNTYHALALDAILKSYPIPSGSAAGQAGNSVRSISGYATSNHFVGGMPMSLASIEARLAELEDPRVWTALHEFAVDAAALPREAYSADDLENQLDTAAANFFADPLKFRIDRDRNRIILSDIFRRRADAIAQATPTRPAGIESYRAADQALLAFILPRIRASDREYIMLKRPAIEYAVFDWSLNDGR